MANRFVDTELWDRPWFMDLTPKLKCLVQYFWAKCDNSGVLRPSWKLISVQIGEEVSEEDLISIDGGKQFEKIDGGKIWSLDFIKFQQKGKLSPSKKPHKQIINLLQEHGIIERFCKLFPSISESLEISLTKVNDNLIEGYTKVNDNLSEISEKVQVKVKVKDKVRGGLGEIFTVEEFREFSRKQTAWRTDLQMEILRRYKRKLTDDEFVAMVDDFLGSVRAGDQPGWPDEREAKKHCFNSLMKRLGNSDSGGSVVQMHSSVPKHTNWRQKLKA